MISDEFYRYSAEAARDFRGGRERAMLASTNKAIRMSFAAVYVLIFAAGFEGAASARPTLAPSLAELEPAISCIDAASNRRGVVECLASHGVPSNYNPSELRTIEDFNRQALVVWSTMAGGRGAPLSSQHFASAIDYTRCIEEATYALGRLQDEPRTAIRAGQAEVQSACANEFSSPESIARRYPGMLDEDSGNLPVVEVKAYLLARIFSGIAYNYVIEANGWVTAEMRTCIRYSDGRPPSASCAGEPAFRAPPPPR